MFSIYFDLLKNYCEEDFAVRSWWAFWIQYCKKIENYRSIPLTQNKQQITLSEQNRMLF